MAFCLVGIDHIGPFPEIAGRVKYAVVEINYLTKGKGPDASEDH